MHMHAQLSTPPPHAAAPSSCPTAAPAARPPLGDVGSDDDWHCTMGSNSDADDEPVVSPSPSPSPPPSCAARLHHEQQQPDDHHHQLDDEDDEDDDGDDDDDDDEQQCILIPNYRGVSNSRACVRVPSVDRARCFSSSSSSSCEPPIPPSSSPPSAPPSATGKHASKFVSFDTNARALPHSVASTLSASSSFSAGGVIMDDGSPSSDGAPPPPLPHSSSSTPSRFAQSKLVATMRQLRNGTSSEKNAAPPLNEPLPKSLSNGHINYSPSSASSSTCISQRSSAVAPPAAAVAPDASVQRGTHMYELPALVPNSNAYKSDRPTSAIAESHKAPGGSGPSVFSLYASPSISRRFSPRRSYQPAPTPTTKTLSFLECVLELLKGTVVHKRRSFMHHPQVYLWLTSDLCEVRYRFSRKGNVPVTEIVPLCNVSKLRGSDRELSMEFSDGRKRVEFMFPSKGSADVWLSGLCCLVPAYASVRSRDQPVGLRENYDPLTDSWNGKKIESRKRLDGYILLGTIGRGSFGKVKLALSTQDRQFYAVKVLSKAMMRKRMRSIPVNGMYVNCGDFGELEAKDVNEIEVMRSLEHENVIQCIGVYNDTSEDRFYIVLEFVARGPIMSSAKLKGADPLNVERARKAFVDVLAGVEYLHHLKIAHRDIKPDNLLEAGDGTVKISDFGAAVKCEAADGGGVAVEEHCTAGTPAFTAPEVAISDNAPKQAVNLLRADMWSLGATLYYMMFGRAPFIARSVFEMYDTICKQELEFPSGVDANSDVCALIRMLLRKDPARRATVEDVLKSAWVSKSAAVAEKVESIRRAVAKHRGDRGVVDVGAAASQRVADGVVRVARGGWYKHAR